MLLIEKESKNEEGNSLCINSEKDFKELDNEIDKVIRGEAPFEEEKINYNSDEELNEKKESKSLKNQDKDFKNNLNKIKILQYLYQIQEENLKKYNQNLISKAEKAQIIRNNLNNIYLNNNNNDSNIINHYINNNDFRKLNNNLFLCNNIQNGELNQTQNKNYNNLDLNKLIYIYNKNIYDCINNNNLNLLSISSLNHNNNCTNYNVNSVNNVNNININNTPLNIINNEFPNKNNPQNILKNNLLNGNNNNLFNLLPNLLNNCNNNFLNNINLNDLLLPIELKMKLLNDNNKCNENNPISNISQLNVNNFQDIYNNINLINNNSQLDFNIHNINNINNQIKRNILLRINQNIQNNQKKKTNENCKENKNYNTNLNRKKNNSTKLDLTLNKNIINLMEIFLLKDKRTTIMIKNIPNKYTISSFLAEINANFKYTYDIFYLPIDYVNKCNLGFAFINFVEPFHIILFYELYRGKKWKKFNSDKICELLYAKFQGKKELIAHFEKGKVLSMDSEDKRPLILPTPNPLPKINLPCYYFDLFIKIYPNISYEIKDYRKYKNNNEGNNGNSSSLYPFFSIKGNFYKK